MNKAALAIILAVVLGISACSRQQSDWEKTRAANTTDAYELFLKKYPNGEFTAQAQARVKELYEERDWQKARDADTPEAYQAFLKQYPEGKWTEEARIRVENFTLAQAPSASGAGTESAAAAPAGSAAPMDATPAPKPNSTMMAAAPDAMTVKPKPKPAPAPAAPAVVKAPPAPAAAPAKAGGAFGIQLGAFKTGADAADKRWSELQGRYPKVLSGLAHRVAPQKNSNGTLYRLQVPNLSEQHARDICKSLEAALQGCLVLPPAKT
jgi:cell division protein FtsN